MRTAYGLGFSGLCAITTRQEIQLKNYFMQQLHVPKERATASGYRQMRRYVVFLFITSLLASQAEYMEKRQSELRKRAEECRKRTVEVKKLAEADKNNPRAEARWKRELEEIERVAKEMEREAEEMPRKMRIEELENRAAMIRRRGQEMRRRHEMVQTNRAEVMNMQKLAEEMEKRAEEMEKFAQEMKTTKTFEEMEKRFEGKEDRLTSSVRPIMAYEKGDFFVANEFQKDFYDVSMTFWRIVWKLLVDLVATIFASLFSIAEWLAKKKELAESEYFEQILDTFENAFTFDRESEFEKQGEVEKLIRSLGISVEEVRRRQIFIMSKFRFTELKNLQEYISRGVGIEFGRNEIDGKKDFVCSAAPVFGYTTLAYYSSLNAAVSLDNKKPEDYLCYRKMIALLCASMRYLSDMGFAFTDGVLWRGMYVSPEDKAKLLNVKKKEEPGMIWGKKTVWKDPFLWPAFISTSTDRDQALEFTCKKLDATDRQGNKLLQQKDDQVLFKIRVEPGYLDTVSDRDLKAVHVEMCSSYMEEKEVLVYPYSEFWVEGSDIIVNSKCHLGTDILQINLYAVGRKNKAWQ